MVASPPAATWRSSGEHEEHRREARQETRVEGLAEPIHCGADLGHVDPEFAHEFRSSRVARVDEIVVVAFEVVLAVLDQDDAVQHRLA